MGRSSLQKTIPRWYLSWIGREIMGFGCFWVDFRGLKHSQECIDIPSYSWKTWYYYTLWFFSYFYKKTCLFHLMRRALYTVWVTQTLMCKAKVGWISASFYTLVLKDLFSTCDFFLFLIKNCHFSTKEAYCKFSLPHVHCQLLHSCTWGHY